MIVPPAFEKVVAAVPGVTDVAGCVVVVVVRPGAGGVTGEIVGAVTVVVVTPTGAWCADGNVVVVVVDAAWPRSTEVDVLVGGPVEWIDENGVDVVGMLQVVIDLRAVGNEGGPSATLRAGMTGSGGAAIALVTAPTPTQLTAVAAAVATTQAAIGRGVTRRIQRFSPPKLQLHAKPRIIRRPPFLTRAHQS